MKEFIEPTKEKLVTFALITLLYILGSVFTAMAPYIPYTQNALTMFIALLALYALACVLIRVKGKSSIKDGLHDGSKKLFEKPL